MRLKFNLLPIKIGNTKRLRVFVFCMVMSGGVIAQNQPNRGAPAVNSVIVEYQQTFNGKPEGDQITLTICGKRGMAALNKSEKIYIDYDSMCYYNVVNLPDGETITTRTPFEMSRNLSESGSNTIQTWNCIKYNTIINSNTVEIWATTEIGLNGTFQPQSGVPQGIVLKIVRNGSRIFEAKRVIRSEYIPELFPKSWGSIVSRSAYNHIINNKDVKTIDIFDDEKIEFSRTLNPKEIESTDLKTIHRIGGGTVILKKVILPQNIDNQQIFARITQKADNDAYDRTGSIFIVPTDKVQSFLNDINFLPSFMVQGDSTHYHGLISTSTYSAPLELVRFFTPFGVGGYNYIAVHNQSWVDSAIYVQNITHLAPQLQGEVWIGAYIGNWVEDGHRLSLKITYYPSDHQTINNVVIPLFNSVNYLEQAGQPYPQFWDKEPLKVTFYIEKKIDYPVLVFTTSGHGGWSNGDEFNPKTNTVSLDGKLLMNYIAWRDDCGSYRAMNPASGNFANGLSSSDLSRSAWCPGTVTNPIYIGLGKNLDIGWHTIEVAIDQGQTEGKSLSYWCVSGAIIGKQL